jgi:hypothetical protein
MVTFVKYIIMGKRLVGLSYPRVPPNARREQAVAYEDSSDPSCSALLDPGNVLIRRKGWVGMRTVRRAVHEQ